MLSFFRKVSKSKIGTGIMALVLIGILGGFALADLKNFGTGDIGLGMGDSALAKVGGERVDEREMSEAMQRRLQEARVKNPNATYATISGDFDLLLDALIDQRALIAFARNTDFNLSKRLIDAEIAQIPQTRGLNGKFSEQGYLGFLAQQRITDAQVRQIISGTVLQRLLLTPVVANARTSVGIARPYASMMLEAREGTAAAVPAEIFTVGLQPSDSDLQAYYALNRARYVVPEQRILRIARIGQEQVAGIVPSDADIATYYKANAAAYAAKDNRALTQVVVPDQRAAAAIASRARSGATIQAASAPAGGNAALTTLKDQSRQAYGSVVGDKAAAAVFGAPSGAVVGPLQSDFGWIVVKIDSARSIGGKSLDQARSEIAAKLVTDKRKAAIEDLVDRVQAAIDDGSNLAEAAAAANLSVTSTPLIEQSGKSRENPSFAFPPDLAPALRSSFEIAPNEPPEIVTLADDKGYALVAPTQIIPAAPASLTSIRARVAADWTRQQGFDRARAAASAISAKLAAGMPFAQALNAAGRPLPGPRPIAARRLQIATAKEPVPPAISALFTLAAGKSRMIAAPDGRGWIIVKVDKITPGNALLQPALIGQMESELQQTLPDEYAQQFIAALRKSLKAKRNEKTIQAARARITSAAS